MGFRDQSPLVSNEWLLEHLGDPDVRVVQADDDQLAYELGHVPGAEYLCWHIDLAASVSRDLLGAGEFCLLMDRLAIGLDTTVVLYGDQMNLWAAYAWWVLRFWGHPDVRLLDGGHAGWARAGLPMVGGAPRAGGAGTDQTATGYPIPPSHCSGTRACRADVERAVAEGLATIVDVRSPAGYEGAVALGGLSAPLTGAIHGGHIPGALSLPWASLVDPDTGLVLAPDELRRASIDAGVPFDREVIVYCELGASSALVCLVLGEILGHQQISNYDGSWLEWAATIGLPVAR